MNLSNYVEVDGVAGAVYAHNWDEPCEICEHYRDLSEKVDITVANPGSGDGLLKGGPRYLTTHALRSFIPESEPIPSTALLYRTMGAGFFTFTWGDKVGHVGEVHVTDVPTKKVKKAAVLEEDEPEAEEVPEVEEAPKVVKPKVGLERWLK